MKIEELDGPAILEFQDQLIRWGKVNYQDFIWRKADSPYAFLIAEVMLHRTRAPQVEPVYHVFIGKYPDLSALIGADPEDVRKCLWSLGLHWRIEKLLLMVGELQKHFNGQIPRDKEALMSLPGVSEYIASAVRCFYWGEPDPLMDTNTVRIAGRVFGLKITDSSRRSKKLRELMDRLVSKKEPQMFNYALLDLAHQVCLPSHPYCVECPLLEMPCEFGMQRIREPDSGQ